MEQNVNTSEEQLELAVQGVATHDDNGDKDQSSSSFGKFSNAKDLLDAYNNLQSEFTRKCQRLSELEKVSASDKEESPQANTISWQQRVSEFLESHPNAKEYAREIADVIYSDKTLENNPSSLEIAFGRILDSKYKSYDKLVQDEEFLDKYIYNNSDITSKILDDYLHNFSKSPQLISSKVGASVNLTPSTKVSSFAEAKELVQKLLLQ